MYDVVIIGAGITGTMLAKDLSEYRLRVAVIDRENDIADSTTMANSAIVHTGYDPEDGTLKALLNPEGSRMYPDLCRSLGCRIREIGSYVAACGEEEEKHLRVLADRAERRGIPYVFPSVEKAREEEPNLADGVTAVLEFPTTAVIYPWEVAIACAEVAAENGTEIFLNSPCTGIGRTERGTYVVSTPERELETRVVVNAAGVGAERVASYVTENPGFEITPRKGEYYVLDSNVKLVNHVIFPVPSKEKGKGVLAVPTVYGNTLIGPNSDFTEDPGDIGTSPEGLAYVRENISRIVKNVPLNRAIRVFAGLRPVSEEADFILEEAEGLPGFVNAASIDSPGLASSPAISKYLIEHFISKRVSLVKNPDAVMTRRAPVVMADFTSDERNELIRLNPAYGRIICRCEQVSEGEILDCIRRKCGARTVKGVKKRVRPGMGRCQGGFCEPRVVEILARELEIDPTEVVLDAENSRILCGENR